jgi:hypothetical protein
MIFFSMEREYAPRSRIGFLKVNLLYVRPIYRQNMNTFPYQINKSFIECIISQYNLFYAKNVYAFVHTFDQTYVLVEFE